MKRLAIMNEKGGVGKSMVACQFAFYAALKLLLKESENAALTPFRPLKA